MENNNCSTCKYHLTLKKHPSNDLKSLKGNITDETGLYACSVMKEEAVIIHDSIFIACELHDER